MTEKRTELITVRGVVQGVGFRPTVYRIAQRLGMKGNVRNMGGIVRIVTTGLPEEIDAFVQEIIARKPLMSRIDGVERLVIETTVFREFSIAPSARDEDEIAVIPADIAICKDCEREFLDKENPRYLHPFISCTNCGPRYTVMKNLPYDRDTTTMDAFPLCEFCESEYTNPSTRRYHAQTVSCRDCGPQPVLRVFAQVASGEKELYETVGRGIVPGCEEKCIVAIGGSTVMSSSDESEDSNDEASDVAASRSVELHGEAAILEAVRILQVGGVLALKGAGGYYLACSPFDEAAVSALRRAKHREEKPFAIMYRDVDQIKDYCRVSPEEELALSSPKRPIVLLEQRPEASAGSPSIAGNVCGSSRFVGAFLPSFGLQISLLDGAGPLIMTSANLSDHPIVTDDEQIFALAGSVSEIAAVLYHTRLIEAGLDDSLLRVIDGKAQLIRRSKGYVPSPILAQTPCEIPKSTTVFAAGPHLKSVLALSRGPFAYLSRHLGDLDSIESEAAYKNTFTRMTNFFGIEPDTVVYDMHPLYFTTRFAEAYAKERQNCGLPVKLIPAQHHHAHIASVMAEHGLAGPVIGVAFDGTGYGADGAIWGGEILICESTDFQRFSHLKYIRMLGGDSSAREAWKAAASHTAAMASPPSADEFEIDLTKYAAYAETQKIKLIEKYVGKISVNSAVSAIGAIFEAGSAKESDAVSVFGTSAAELATAAAAIEADVECVTSSSMGRLFDAVSSMLGICNENRYEGECASMLENAAQRALDMNAVSRRVAPAKLLRTPDLKTVGGDMVSLNEETLERDRLALYFHLDVAQAILQQCTKARAVHSINKVCLSGGVFQNRILLEETLRLLRADCFEVYYNIHVPPNDGGIALGQSYIGMLT